MENIKKLYRKEFGDEFVEFIECLENDLKPFATLVDYSYLHSKEYNYHTYRFELKDKLSDEQVQKIDKIINTYDEGCVTYGVIFLGETYVTIVGTD